MRSGGRFVRGLAAVILLSGLASALAGCVEDHRGPGWYHYGHRWHHRPPPVGVVVD